VACHGDDLVPTTHRLVENLAAGVTGRTEQHHFAIYLLLKIIHGRDHV